MHPFKKIKGYRCYAIRSSYNINLIVYIYTIHPNIHVQALESTHTAQAPTPYPFQNRRDMSRVTLTKLCVNQHIPLNINAKRIKTKNACAVRPYLPSGMPLGSSSGTIPTLALQITDYSYFENSHAPLSVRHKKFYYYNNLFLVLFSSL